MINEPKYQYIDAHNMDNSMAGTLFECEEWVKKNMITSLLVAEISEETNLPKTIKEMLIDEHKY